MEKLVVNGPLVRKSMVANIKMKSLNQTAMSFLICVHMIND